MADCQAWGGHRKIAFEISQIDRFPSSAFTAASSPLSSGAFYVAKGSRALISRIRWIGRPVFRRTIKSGCGVR